MWVELRLALPADVLHGAFGADAAAMGTVGGDRYERVADGYDPAGQRDRLPAESIRVAGAVPPLVVGPHELSDLAHDRARPQQFGA